MAKDVSLFGYLAVKLLYWSTPGGHVSQGIEDYGMHHWGEVVTYFGGFLMPMIYGVVLIHLGDRLFNSYGGDMSFENGYVVSIVMLFFGYATVLCCLYAQFCEFLSRVFSYNPKTNVTNQDTFIQRASSFVNHQSNVSMGEVEIDEWNT